mgnify:CR=1 FL=1
MKFVDTHAHLYLDKFQEDIDQVVSNAISRGVSEIYLPNIDTDTLESLNALTLAYPHVFKPMIGLHPCDVKEDYQEKLRTLKVLADKVNYIAIGEIGMDLYWDKSTKDIQEDAFLIQCDWAKEYKLPIAIHSRDSTDELIDLLEVNRDLGIGGVFHCFTGTNAQAIKILDLGFYLGIGGVVTFKNSGLRDELKGLPLDRIVLETDAPFLAPVPHRGKRNESSYIPLIAEELTKVFNCDLSEIAKKTTENAHRLFGL